MNFKQQVSAGIPDLIPQKKEYDKSVNHAPIREDILNTNEKKLALKNALRYFDKKFHKKLIVEFKNELDEFGRIYMYRFRPDYEMYARPIDEYPYDDGSGGSALGGGQISGTVVIG